jgi:hypothetical protein
LNCSGGGIEALPHPYYFALEVYVSDAKGKSFADA